jgi:hypothetical protein
MIAFTAPLMVLRGGFVAYCYPYCVPNGAFQSIIRIVTNFNNQRYYLSMGKQNLSKKIITKPLKFDNKLVLRAYHELPKRTKILRGMALRCTV